jgi:hypothetical protein
MKKFSIVVFGEYDIHYLMQLGIILQYLFLKEHFFIRYHIPRLYS